MVSLASQKTTGTVKSVDFPAPVGIITTLVGWFSVTNFISSKCDNDRTPAPFLYILPKPAVIISFAV